MADQTRSGFSFAGESIEITEYVVPADDTSPYALGDPIVALGELFIGRLPDGRSTQGMFTAELAASGAPVSGVIVGILPTADTAGNVRIPEEKFHPYVIRVRSVEDAVFEIQCDNTTRLTDLGIGTTANFVVAEPNGSVSGFYVDSTSFGSGTDLTIVGLGRNFGANSTVYARFAVAATGSGGVQLAGDLGGTEETPLVESIQGVTVNGKAVATTTGDAVLEFLGTFNGSGQTLTGLSIDVSDTASSLLSGLIDAKIDGNTYFRIGRAYSGCSAIWLPYGAITPTQTNFLLLQSALGVDINSPSGTRINVGVNSGWGLTVQTGRVSLANAQDALTWGAGSNVADLFLYRDAANVLAQRNGTAAQESRIYRSYVDGSNLGYTGLKQDATTGFILDSVYSGSVPAPTNLLDVRVNGASKARLSSGGVLSILQTTHGDIQLALSNGVDTLDIGALGSYLSQIAANNSIVLKSSGLSIQSQGAPFSSAPININSNGISAYKTGFLFGRHAGAASSTPVSDNKTWFIHEAQVNNDVAPIFTIASGAADPAATTNLVGGTININGGDGASSSSGDAHGGPLNLNGGRGYGTGRHGSIAYGTVRGSLVPGGTLATTMTDGFLSIPSAAGAPSGTPQNTTGTPLYFDSANLKLYAYTGGAWKSSAAFT